MSDKVYAVIEHTEYYNSDSELVPQMEIKGIFSSLERAKEYAENNFKDLTQDRYGLKCDLGGKVVAEYNVSNKACELGVTIEEYKIN